MANEKEINENEKLPMQTRVDATVYGVVSKLATADERSLSNMIERLLKTHPRVQPMIETEPATTGATA